MAKTSTATRRAGIYLRISEDRTGREAGVTRQEKDCVDLAGRLGWDVVDIYADNDISAYNGKRRPHYERLKADLKAGRIDAVVCWHPDRLYRRSRDLLDLIDLLGETKPEVATVQAGAVDLSTPNGRLVAKIGADVAEHESEHKAERVKRWHKERAEAGAPNGGRRAFGFHRLDKHRRGGDGRVLPCPTCGSDDTDGHCPAEAALIREAVERLLAGEKRFDIVTDWNRRGLRTTGGNPWGTTSFVGTLRSPRVAGLRQHNGRHHPAAWEPILTLEEWEAVKAALKSNRAKPGRPRVYPLSGLVRCGLCGTGMVGNKLMSGARVYRCPTVQQHGHGCGHVARDARHVEGYVKGEVIDAYRGAGLDRHLAVQASDDTRDALAAAAALEKRLARLKTEYAVGGPSGEEIWTKADFLAHKAELEARITEAADKVDAAGDRRLLRRIGPGVDLDAWWDTADAGEVRQLVALVVDRIEIAPAGRGGTNRFDPDKVRIVWRA